VTVLPVVVVLLAVLVVVGVQLSRNRQSPGVRRDAVSTESAVASTVSAALPAPSTAVAKPAPTSPALRPVFAGFPVRFQFDDLHLPSSLAVDNAGNLFIGDWNVSGGRLLKLAAGETDPTVLPISGLGGPCGIAVNSRGDLFVIDTCSNAGSTLLKIPAGSSSPIELRPDLPAGAKDIAIDSHDSLYLLCSNRFGGWVKKLAPGSTTPEEFPHSSIDAPTAIAVDADDNVYIAGYPNKVTKFPADGGAPVDLPFTGLSEQNAPQRIAVDAAGTVYVLAVHYEGVDATATSTVLALPAGSAVPIRLNFGDMLNQSNGIAVDASGVYAITDPAGSNGNGYLVLLRRSE
jgi:serine/threonine-protein kinase